MKETIIVRASKQAAAQISAAIDLVKEQILESHAQQGNLRQVIGKPYIELTRDELDQLAVIYHKDDEPFPCILCQWVAKNELEILRRQQNGME